MSIGTSTDISLYGHNTTSAAPLETSLPSTYGWLRFGLEDVGSIGAFYFGPPEAIFTPEAAAAYYTIPAPTISTELPPIPVPAVAWGFFKALTPTVITTSDITVDFIGVPRSGSSPLSVDFTAIVTLGGGSNGKYLVKEYHWYFDYVNYPSVYEISTEPTINHVYTGYYGKKFTVKLSVVLK